MSSQLPPVRRDRTRERRCSNQLRLLNNRAVDGPHDIEVKSLTLIDSNDTNGLYNVDTTDEQMAAIIATDAHKGFCSLRR